MKYIFLNASPKENYIFLTRNANLIVFVSANDFLHYFVSLNINFIPLELWRHTNWALEGCCANQCDGEVGHRDKPSVVGCSSQASCVLPPIKRTASTYNVGQQGESIVMLAASSHAITANIVV